MNRDEHRQKVAARVTQHIAKILREEAGANPLIFAEPRKHRVTIVDPETDHKLVHENIRFCCPLHAWYDLERAAAIDLLNAFGYLVLKVIKMDGPPKDWV